MAVVQGKIVGLSWRRLGEMSPDKDENEFLATPRTRSKSRKSVGATVAPLTESNARVESGGGAGKAILRRAMSVRDAFGTLRQKMKVSTRRRKRLTNVSPYPDSATTTPGSASRRSARIANRDINREEVKLYSPFRIDTPSAPTTTALTPGAGRGTPRQIRMGIHQPKRFNFSSPGRYRRDIDTVAAGIQAMVATGDSLSVVIDKDGGYNNVASTSGPSS